MSRLHKITKFPLVKKYYFLFSLLILSGCYKNGIIPFINKYNSLTETIIVFLLPILSIIIGHIFDYIFKNNEIFNSKFYSLLFVIIIPISTNIVIYIIILSILLFVYNLLIKKNIDSNINFIAIGKIILVLLLIVFNIYSYQNNLESSGIFQYSFIDSILGHNVSGLFTSNILFIIISLIVLGTDDYYKKEIPLYSYGIYIIILAIYSFIKQNMAFLLINMVSSNILFALIFIAPLSCYSPYNKKEKLIYSLIIGFLILPFSLTTNFFEGIYISIIISNIVIIIINLFFKKTLKCTNN